MIGFTRTECVDRTDSHETMEVGPFSGHRHRQVEASPQGVPERSTGPGTRLVDRSAGQAAPRALRGQPTSRPISV